ncbi:MAG: hypothetical protein DRP09_16975 [Candidatus Thorarchaeota archaeon]|nr:MAG: hypothetical protein DRP09_16975 [Candidatus Thorarchaeota archaeon]
MPLIEDGKMKIILADPPIIKNSAYKPNTYTPNLGILYLISYLRNKFNNLEMKYLESFLSLKQHVKEVREYNPDIYCISFPTLLANAAYKTINIIKNESRSLPIICGGPHPTADPEDVFANSKADICVIGEGEETLTELVAYYMNRGKHKQLEDIKGIAYRKSDNVIYTQKRPLIKDLDSIPFPAWDVIDMKKYPGPTRLRAYPFRMVLVSRGCPYNCNFCSNPVWKTNKPWLRLRSPKNIAKEIELYYNRDGIREIQLLCDEFNVDLNWSIEVCNEIKRLGYDDLYFNTLLRVDKVTEELAKALADINCWAVHIGIESGNQRTLDGINKKITLEQVVNACKILKKYNIRIFGFAMMLNIWEENGELCYESPDDVMRTLNFMRKLIRNKLIDYMSWGFVVPLPGAPLYDICKKHGLISGDRRLDTWKWGGMPVKLPNIEEKIMQRIKRKGMFLQMWCNFRHIRDLNWRNYRYILGRIVYIFKK